MTPNNEYYRKHGRNVEEGEETQIGREEKAEVEEYQELFKYFYFIVQFI